MKNPNPEQTHFTKKRYNATSIIYNLMEWPVEQLWYKKWRQKLWQNIHGPSVLEIGVGTGKNIPFYPGEIKLTGIDLSPGMLKRAKQLIAEKLQDNVTLKEMDAQDMNFPDNHFDDVVATFVFCSVPDPILGLKEALRVTRPGGKLHLLEHMRSENPVLGFLMDTLDTPIHYISGVHIARQTVANVEKAGWNIEQLQDLTAKGIFKRIEATRPH
ncbi:phosphatidylethanolamine N-methyltransferase /phosphatidyl-N-methylethanolamine N-methyltransferase [Fodinibius roseus]|uniref:Phosphatidylethanolamine N-methyltransferase /phosphatidyl-N-methylethanolamine N-methyltransferase n=1 Tax=Fodinibius roseus TaxID=1194090 RepID=A0A1M5G283_9BACT|nr:class I SAM-dependent methyltransferase [Fodinibius roseus]SHF97829.1 phosphatidylethanolamine N-methyltransferase /phosphatidyl-N-methylethanolamine N-methyltransferase [Fodinibius roseus]